MDSENSSAPKQHANDCSANRVFAEQVVRELREAGFESLWAGGCVRDLLLGNEPHDYDVATSATPEQVRRLFGRRRTIAVGAAFGVMIVLPDRNDWSDGIPEQIEVATFRTDSTYSDGRRPDAVQYSTPEQDAQRRDFTINGMFFDPLADRVIDYVGGEADLGRGVVRAIGNAADRIAEDKLRMLRAVRFAARFSFALEERTAAAVAASAADVHVVSGERIATEVTKTLQTERYAWAIEQWHELRLLREILPELADSWHRWPYALKVLAALESQDWRCRLAAVMVAAELNREVVGALRERWKLSNLDTNCLEEILASISPLVDADGLPWSHVQPYVGSEQRELNLAVASAVAQVESRHAGIEVVRRKIDSGQELSPQPWVMGQDLIDLGLRPGPRFKELLGAAWRMQLDGELPSRDAALEWVGQTAQDSL
ncbi:MAG: CCA tRNA nucleotidyltransferase [Planctomycetota bacterium]